MSLTLSSYPTALNSNVLAGFKPQKIGFVRKDIELSSLEQGSNNRILVKVFGDITADLQVLDFVYLYGEGLSYIYSESLEVASISYNATTLKTEILLEGAFVQTSSFGYLNYKQNYYVEIQLFDVLSTALISPISFSSAGTSSGLVEVDVTLPADRLQNETVFSGAELTNGRIKFKAKYRESYNNNRDANFIVINEDPIILIRSARYVENEKFATGFNLPIWYKGYPNLAFFIHSDLNDSSSKIKTTFDELDVNKIDITTDNQLTDFNQNTFGQLISCSNDKIISYDSNTCYLRIKANSIPLAEYSPTDYNSTDYKTV